MLKSERITIWGILLNLMLFVAKFIVGLISQSIAVTSDALNSFADILASVSIYIAVKVSNKKADESHPFGHDRAEPIAAFVVAIFTGILAFEVGKTAILGFFTPHEVIRTTEAMGVLLFTILVKAGMAVYFLRQGKDRPAIKATGIDSRNDVFVSTIALLGVIGALFGHDYLDDIAALFISAFIFYSGYKLGIENIDYLMGKTPSAQLISKIKEAALRVKGVKGINDLRAHYVGNKIHVEVHIELDEKLSTRTSHDIGKKAEAEIEKISGIYKAFIHIDPV